MGVERLRYLRGRVPGHRDDLRQSLRCRQRYSIRPPFTVAGDCRAVLGKKSDDTITAVPLTKDHNIREPEELKKLKAAHPSGDGAVASRIEERDLVKYFDGKPVYVKGMLQPTRCIGDFVLKKKEFIEAIPLLKRFASFNPPYITCTPEVTAFDIRSEDEFVVMASDGIWDELENQEVVDIVAEALEKGNSVEAAANTVVETCLAHAASGCFGDV